LRNPNKALLVQKLKINKKEKKKGMGSCMVTLSTIGVTVQPS
jgi:hypothetical protein